MSQGFPVLPGPGLLPRPCRIPCCLGGAWRPTFWAEKWPLLPSCLLHPLPLGHLHTHAQHNCHKNLFSYERGEELASSSIFCF